MRLGNRVNEGHAELSVCLYLPGGRIACSFRRPGISANDRFEAGGLTYSVIEPFRSVAMRYEGELHIVDDPEALRDPQKLFATGPRAPGEVTLRRSTRNRRFTAARPAHDGVQTMYGRDFSLGHFNQHGRVARRDPASATRLGQSTDAAGATIPGVRATGRCIYYYRLFIANFSNGDGFMLLKITDRSGHARRVGVLLVDGAYEEITDLDVITDWTERQDPARVRLGVRTAHRKAVISAEILTLAPLRNRRQADGETLVSRIAEGFTPIHMGRPRGLRHDRIYRAHRRRKAGRLSAMKPRTRKFGATGGARADDQAAALDWRRRQGRDRQSGATQRARSADVRGAGGSLAAPWFGPHGARRSS